ncbi:MAG: hypothetical protein R3C46_05290 [Hyphomonadaceae bacterium]
MADLVQMLTQVRAHYVDMFETALKELRDKGHRLIIEPPAVDEAGQLAREGVLDLGMRYDLALEEDGAATPSQFSPSRMLKFEPEAFHGAGLNIVLEPFRWDEARLVIEGDPDAVAAALKDWFENAIAAPDDVREDEIQRAAHFLSDPEVAGRTTLVQADLGTVDVHVVIALFDELRLAGASRVEVGMAEG